MQTWNSQEWPRDPVHAYGERGQSKLDRQTQVGQASGQGSDVSVLKLFNDTCQGDSGGPVFIKGDPALPSTPFTVGASECFLSPPWQTRRVYGRV